VPVIEVDGHVAICDGGGGALGHPVEYIQLDTISKEPAVCKYCGKLKLRFHLLLIKILLNFVTTSHLFTFFFFTMAGLRYKAKH
jgi:uncharacterized Zn-finger protein